MVNFVHEYYELWIAFKGLFTLNGNALTDLSVQSEFLNHVVFLAVAVLACTPILPAIGRAFESLREKAASREAGGASKVAVVVYDVVTAVIPVGLVFLALLCLVGDSYNPFLYFQF